MLGNPRKSEKGCVRKLYHFSLMSEVMCVRISMHDIGSVLKCLLQYT